MRTPDLARESTPAPLPSSSRFEVTEEMVNRIRREYEGVKLKCGVLDNSIRRREREIDYQRQKIKEEKRRLSEEMEKKDRAKVKLVDITHDWHLQEQAYREVQSRLLKKKRR